MICSHRLWDTLHRMKVWQEAVPQSRLDAKMQGGMYGISPARS